MPFIVVSGAIANKPANGGEAWIRLSWLRGFQQLGCESFFIEQIDRNHCTDERGAIVPPEQSVQVRYFRHVIEQAGVAEIAVLVDERGQALIGPKGRQLEVGDLNNWVAGLADLLVNISGHLHCEPLFSRFRRKAYIDIDPGFTQFWHAASNPGARLAGHDFFFTIGENIGAADCSIPTNGIPWQPVRQPVVLDDWPVLESAATLARPRFTTVASWRGAFGQVEHGGRRFGLKCHEFRKFLELPRRVPGCDFEIALAIHPADERDRRALLDHGWIITDPTAAAGDVDKFRDYVLASSAEFSVAQGIYVETNSGWFSDRTVRYLAAGKPVLVQEAGFSRNLPTGEGLLFFCTLDEAARGAESIARDYARHSRAARRLAADYFDARVVLPRFLETCGITS